MERQAAAKTAQVEKTAESRSAAREPAPDSSSADLLLWFQRSLGNRALGRLLQAKLKVGAANDRYEQEADRVANHVVGSSARDASYEIATAPPSLQRSACGGGDCACGEHKEERPLLQRTSAVAPAAGSAGADGGYGSSSASDGASVPDHVEARLDASRGSGEPLSHPTRQFMESRFGYDFSGVRVHTGSAADDLNRNLGSVAFTTGSDIYFATDRYEPGKREGDHLLAHELTHVVQQNPTIARKPARPRGDANRGAQPRVIQRKPFFFSLPTGVVGGTKVHNEVLPAFIKDAKNPTLFIEAPIPGARKLDVDKGAKGRADFYSTAGAGGASRTIAIKFDGEPKFLAEPGQMEFGGGAYSHKKNAAPRGWDKTPRVRELASAPTHIEIGDLKPGFSSESFLGGGQVADYSSGIKNTAADINTYLAANPNEADAKAPGGGPQKWGPSPVPMKQLEIPNKIKYSVGNGLWHGPLALYEMTVLNAHRVLEDTGLRGAMYVYQESPGIWAYEWFPDNVLPSTGSSLVNTVLDRLNTDVIPAITAAPPQLVMPRKIASVRRAIVTARTTKPVVQREPKKFDDGNWQRLYYKPWLPHAEKLLGDKKEVGKARVAQALVELEERSHKNIGIPDAVKEQGKGLDKIKHWKSFGTIYGWLREKLDWFYVKFQKMANWVKDKVKKLAKSKAVSSLGSWIKAAAQAIFKIFKLVGSWVLRQTADRLVGSLREGISNNLKKLTEMATPEGVKGKLAEFENLKQEYNEIVEKKEEELSEKLFGDHLALFNLIEKFEEAASLVSTIVSLVEWGVRLIACASPPAIGCLWNLAISALQYAFGLLMQTCWFTKKVYGPVMSYVDIVRTFPAKVASKIVPVANSVLPVPAGFDKWFAPIVIDTNTFDDDPCDEAGDSGGAPLTPEREALLELEQELGPDTFNALLELMNKRGAGPWVLVTVDRIEKMKAFKGVDAKVLRELIEGKPTSTTQTQDELLADIAKYTAREKKTAKEYFEEKAKRDAAREAAKAATGKKGVEPGGTTSSGKKPGGGGAGDGGAVGGITVLDGSEHVIHGSPGALNPTARIAASIATGSADHAKHKPDVVSADILVDGKQRYRVNNIRVKEVRHVEILAVPNQLFITYVLENGLQLNIDGAEVLWRELQWEGAAPTP